MSCNNVAAYQIVNKWRGDNAAAAGIVAVYAMRRLAAQPMARAGSCRPELTA